MFRARRRLRISVLVAAMLATMAIGIGTHANADAVGWRYIRNPGSGKCIDTALENGWTVQIWTCVDGDPKDQLPLGMEQHWDINPTVDQYNRPAIRIKNRMFGGCLNSTGLLTPTQVIASNCDSWDTRWYVIYQNKDASGWYQVLRSYTSGLCLDLTNNNSNNGTRIQQYYCDFSFTNPAQKWRLGESLPVPGGITVPDVRNLGAQVATDIVNGGGLKAVKSYKNDCVAPGDVVSQSPAGGTQVAPGTVVNLTVSTCTGGGTPK